MQGSGLPAGGGLGAPGAYSCHIALHHGQTLQYTREEKQRADRARGLLLTEMCPTLTPQLTGTVENLRDRAKKGLLHNPVASLHRRAGCSGLTLPVPSSLGRDRAAFPTQGPFVMERGGMSLSPDFCQIWLKSAGRLKSYYSRHVAGYRQAWTAPSHKLYFIRKLH